MTSAADFGAWKERACSPARGGEGRNPGSAWRRVQHLLTTKFSGEVNRWTGRPSGRRVYQEDNLDLMNLKRRVRDFSKRIAARGGAWLAFGWPDFWVFLAGCRGACLCGLFLQVKARFPSLISHVAPTETPLLPCCYISDTMLNISNRMCCTMLCMLV